MKMAHRQLPKAALAMMHGAIRRPQTACVWNRELCCLWSPLAHCFLPLTKREGSQVQV